MLSRKPGMRAMRRDTHIDMLHGPLLGKILLFALPLAASSMLQQLFNTADAMVAGQFVGTQALAAVGANSQVISLLVNLFVGLSIGANVTVAVFLGRQDERRAGESAHTALMLALLSGVVLLGLGLVCARPILVLIGTPDDVLDQAVSYLHIYFLGMPFFMFYNFASAVLRSKGDTRRPLYALLVATILNVALNLAFTCLVEWGVAGIAVATVIANATSSTILLVVLMREDDCLRLDPKRLGLKRAHVASIVKIGLPAGIQGAVFALSNVCIQSAINGFGSAAIAGSTASMNYEYLTYNLVNAFSQAAVTFTSQNYALRQYDRCDRVMRLCLVGGFVASSLSVALFVGFQEFCVGLFATEATAVAFGMTRMVHVELFEPLCDTYEVPGGAMRGMGHSMLPALITVVGSCLLRFVWVYLVYPHFMTFESLIVVYPVTWVVTGTAMIAAYLFVRKTAYRSRG